MAIASMKKLTLAASKADRGHIISEMMRLGFIEIDDPNPDEKLKSLMTEGKLYQDCGKSEDILAERDMISGAITLLDTHAPVKKPMFSPKPGVREYSLFDKGSVDKAVETAEVLKGLSEQYETAKSDIRKLETEAASLLPWENMDVPMDMAGGKSFRLIFGKLPVYIDTKKLEDEIRDNVKTGGITVVNTDKLQIYLYALAGNEEFEALLRILRTYGFSEHSFKGEKGTVKERLAELKRETENAAKERDGYLSEIREYQDKTALLERAYDALTNEAERENVRKDLLLTKNTFFLEGYLPESREKEAENLFERLGCAYSLEKPDPDDDVPVRLDNTKVVEPFGEITSMYGMPAYNSFIDPNPTMALFYFISFGIMLSDAAYGILLFLGCLFMLKKTKPTGSMKNMLTMFMYCGISTVIWGAVFGSWFGNAVTVISSGLFHREVVMPTLVDPINDPIKMMIISYIIGGIQILTAMFLDSLRRIKRKDYKGAIFGIYSWYVLFAGLGLLFKFPAAGKYVALTGAVMVIIGGSFGKKGFGKLLGGLMTLYGISGYLSDLLSYSRLLALCLSTAVVANVVNTMGSLPGFSIGGTICFFAVFLFGHALNIVLNLLGSYVHSSRLQYIEYFGRFYEGGGRTFRPLALSTKYVSIIREE